MLVLFAQLFFGGIFTLGVESLTGYVAKLVFLILVYFNIRSILPNLRFDQVMALHWKYVLPVNLVYFLLLVQLM